jgi:hypothetical protein
MLEVGEIPQWHTAPESIKRLEDQHLIDLNEIKSHSTTVQKYLGRIINIGERL